jgi:hypothetical protein
MKMKDPAKICRALAGFSLEEWPPCMATDLPSVIS